MVKRKERIVTDLYKLEVSSQTDKRIHRHTTHQNVNLRVDPGTCNVCSAPCSSCLHVHQTCMEPKIDESLDDTSRESAISYSVDDTVQNKKSIGCKSSQLNTSEASNMISVNSNLVSCSENAERKAGRKLSKVSGKSQDVEVPKTVLSGGSVRGKLRSPSPHKKDVDDGTTINKFGDLRGLEGHDDNISCVSGSYEASNISNSGKGFTDTKVITSTASPRSLASEEYIKAGQPEEASFMDKPESEVIQNKPSGEVVSIAVYEEKSASYASHDIQDNKIGHVGGNSEHSAIEWPKVEAESDSDDLPTKTVNSLEQKKEVEKASELLAEPEARETSMHSDPVNESDESEILEHDQALVGEGSGEEQLFSAEGCITKEGCGDELTSYIERLKNKYGVSCSCPEVGESPRVHKFQVLARWSMI